LTPKLIHPVKSESHRAHGSPEDLCEQLIVGSAMTGQPPWFALFDGQPLVSEEARPYLSFSHCVDAQLAALRLHFQLIRQLAGDAGVSIGLSGGYDSRLVLLLAVEAGIPVHPYCYGSPKHAQENALAQQVSAAAGLPLRVIPVRRWTDLKEGDLEANIVDALAFFAGRTNKTMGTFNDVHTARIHRECMGPAAVNLNGLGGELYRNRERLPPFPFSFTAWLWQYVAGPDLQGAFTAPRDREHFESYFATRHGAVLGLSKLKWLDRHLARRWYRDIWLPHFAGARLAAERRVGRAMMPFADPAVSATALAATPFIGAHGELEAELLRRLDAGIAALPSSYGAGFGRIPRHRRLKDAVMALAPIAARLARNRLRQNWRGPRTSTLPAPSRERFQDALANLQAQAPSIDVGFLLGDCVSRDRTLYIAEFLFRQRKLGVMQA